MSVIRRHQHEVKECCERQVAENPDLAGKVALNFIIEADGQVSAATDTEDTIGSGVGNCMVARVKRWRFPAPEGGGIVDVNFPWVFKVAGGTR